MNPKTLAEVWRRLEAQLAPGVDEDRLADMRQASYIGASAYSRLLLNGISARREVEDFFATRPDSD